MSDPALEQLFDFLRFPSISADSAYVADLRSCAQWLHTRFLEMGLDAEVCETGGHPAVIAATVRDPAKRTVLIYGHYDVQPVDPLGLWDSPPFEPVVVGDLIRARGATDNKGQIWAHIQGCADLLRERGELPVNLVFLIEGEEEVGSSHLKGLLVARREQLACDVIAVSDTGMVAPGVPTLSYGLRGIAAVEVYLRGAPGDLHSGVFGGAIANAARAAGILAASLHDGGGRVAVPGFYDRVRPLEDWERAMWAKSPEGDAQIARAAGVDRLVCEEGYTGIECVGGRPTAEVNGIGGGYQGEGSKTVLPAEAMLKLTFRLVPDQEPATIMDAVEQHLRSVPLPGIRVDVRRGHGGLPYIVDARSVYALAAQRALRTAFGKEPVLMREGGTIPVLQTFRDVLGADALLMGLALSDSNMHAPNETFPVENFHAGRRLHAALLDEIARV